MEKSDREHPLITSLDFLCQEALTYSVEFGFSVIPVRPDKKPFIKWEELKTREWLETTMNGEYHRNRLKRK